MTQGERTAEAIFVWDGEDIEGLRKFVKPYDADHTGSVAGIPGMNGAEILVPGNCITRYGPGHFAAYESEDAANADELMTAERKMSTMTKEDREYVGRLKRFLKTQGAALARLDADDKHAGEEIAAHLAKVKALRAYRTALRAECRAERKILARVNTQLAEL